MALLQQCARHDADRVGEVDDPRVVGGALAHRLGDVEDDGHRAQRLGEPAGAGGLLPDAVAHQRERLVAGARPLPADAQLQQHCRRAVDRGVAVAREREARRRPALVQDALREAADDVEPLGVGVEQHQLLDGQHVAEPCQAVDQLGRVRRSASDDGELHAAHPFTPVRVIPSTNTFWARKNTTSTGIIARMVAAIVRFHCTWYRLRNDASPSEIVQLSGFSLV